MIRIKEKFIFYKKTAGVITLLNLIFFCCLGMYLEDYEGIFSTFIQGTYTKPANAWWDVNNHLLLLYIYEMIVSLVPDYNIYGIVLVIYNWVFLSLSGFVLFRIIKINLGINDWLLFVLLYSILCLDNFLNLNCTRQAFVLITAVLGYIESRRFENKRIYAFEWFCLSLLIFFASLIRFEAVFLFCIIYILILLIYKRFTKFALLPFFISGLVFLVYLNIIANQTSEAKKAFIYKEKEITFRNNIDFQKLSPGQRLDVQAITGYFITDKEHFTLDFYDSISKHKTQKGILRFFEGFNQKSFFITLRVSYEESRHYLYLFLFYLVSIVFIFINKRELLNHRSYILHSLFFVLFPFLLCFQSVVPPRFTGPYFITAIVLNLLIYISKYRADKRVYYFCLVFLFVLIFNLFSAKQKYIGEAAKYNEITSKLLLLDKNQHSDNPIIINNFFTSNYYPVKPLDKLPKQHALFLNYYLFSSWDFHQQSWNDVCHCNPLSLKEKIDYTVANQNLFLIDEDTFVFLSNYMYLKYHVRLSKTNISDFDKNIMVCKLKYE